MLTAWQPPQEIPPVVVLRKLLRGPLTLGHVLLLHEMGNPIVAGKPSGLDDLAQAVMVCQCATEGEAKSLLLSASNRIGRWFVSRWGRRVGVHGLDGEFQRFADWFTAQTSGPAVDDADEKQKPKAITSPWPIYLQSVAMSCLHLSPEDSRRQHVRTLKQWLGAHAESQGSVKFVTEELQEALDRIEKAEAAMVAKHGGAA